MLTNLIPWPYRWLAFAGLLVACVGFGWVGPKYGGFRPQSCPIGAPQSAHKVGMAVDIYDPSNALDEWITDEVLTQCGLYREAPRATDTWCHLTTRRPPSGKRTFIP